LRILWKAGFVGIETIHLVLLKIIPWVKGVRHLKSGENDARGNFKLHEGGVDC